MGTSRTVLCEGQVGIARAQNLIVILAREVLTLNSIRLIDSVVRDTRASGGSAFFALYLIKHDQPQNSNEVRREMIEVVQRHRGALKGLGVVQSGTGFVAATQRGLLTVITSALGQRGTIGIFPDLDACARWLIPKMSGAVTLQSIRELLSQIEQALDGPRQAQQADGSSW